MARPDPPHPIQACGDRAGGGDGNIAEGADGNDGQPEPVPNHVPAESEEACDSALVDSAAASSPCEALQVITGTYESEPPPPPQ